jgi:hypothetical protein
VGWNTPKPLTSSPSEPPVAGADGLAMAMAGEVHLSVVAAGEIASQSPALPLSFFLRCCCTWRMSLLYLS